MSSSFLKFAAISTLVIGLAGCGTVYNGSTTDVAFNLNGADNADCYVQNPDYKVHINAPMSYPLQNSRYPYEVVCYKRGYNTFVGQITPAVSSDHKLNAVNLGAGVPVDFASQSVFELPETFDITMIPLDGSNVLGFEEKSVLTTMDPVLEKEVDKTAIEPDLKFVYTEEQAEKITTKKQVRVTDVETVTGYDFPITEQTEMIIKREPQALTETKQVREVIDVKTIVEPMPSAVSEPEADGFINGTVKGVKNRASGLFDRINTDAPFNGQSATGAPLDVKNPYND